MAFDLAAFRARLSTRRSDLQQFGALVDPVRLLDAIMADFDEALRVETDTLRTLTDAARECGYSADSLGRMVRAGKTPNDGRAGAPRVGRGDLPRRSGRMGKRSAPAAAVLHAAEAHVAEVLAPVRAQQLAALRGPATQEPGRVVPPGG